MVCKSEEFTGLRERHREWSNWSGDVSYVAQEYFEPEHSAEDSPPDGLQQLVHVVALATEKRRCLHAVGSGWAYEDAARSDAWLVSLRRLTRRLHHVVDDAETVLTDEWRQRQLDPDGQSRLVHVEAGIDIASLNELLAGEGLAMPTLGGANAQSLAGAISTSTHGGDLECPPLPDLVRAIHLVTAGGREFWIERGSAPITEDARLRNVLHCPDTEIVRSDEIFDAAVVSVGRFGVLYSLVLEVRRAFRLVEVVTRPTAEEVLTALREGQDSGNPFGPILGLLSQTAPPAGLAEADGVIARAPPVFLQLLFNPQNAAECWAHRRWETVEPDDLPPPDGVVRGELTGAGVFLVAEAAFRVAAVLALAIPVVGIIYSIRLNMAATDMERLAASGQPTLGAAAAAALNAAFDLPFVGEAIPAITSAVVGNRFEDAIAQGRRGPSHIITSGRRVDSQDIPFRGDYIEMVFDASQPGFIEFLEVIRRTGQSFRQVGYVSLRPSLRSRATLSMHNVKGPRAVSIEVTALKGLRDNLIWMAILQAEGIRLGGRPHWGQFNRLEPQTILALYEGRLNAWREALVLVSGLSDTFSNKFCRTRGLEPTGIVREVTAVHRTGRGVITHLCGAEGATWSPVTREVAIKQIRSGAMHYFARFGEGRLAEIHVVRTVKGGAYLRTASDDTGENNLDNLPECEA